MKKIFALIILGILLPLTFASANYDDDVWSYTFHLQYKDGVLGVNDSEKNPYTPIPGAYTQTEDPKTTDFVGKIISVKGKELGVFGFNKPTSMIISLGKSILEVQAPYFADADHVSFFDKKGTRLFNISLLGSSFCNDDNVCNAKVGENSANCPNDCGGGITTTQPQAIPPQTEVPATTTQIQNTPTPEQVITSNGEQPTPVASATISTAKKPITSIVMFVGGILLVLLAIILWYTRRKTP